jgi:hypothetical protein
MNSRSSFDSDPDELWPVVAKLGARFLSHISLNFFFARALLVY